jgi:group I intron endonuclease
MTPGIYCIENLINGKKYVGKGENVEKRMKNPHKECIVIYNALQYYGDDNFKRYIIEYCPSEELTEKECFYIKELDTKVPNGYNATDGGEGMPGYRHTDEAKAKISKASKEMVRSKEMYEKVGDALRGRKKSPEAVEKNRLSHIGIPITSETRRKMALTNSGPNNYMYGKIGKDNPSYGKKRKNTSSPYYGVVILISGENIFWQVGIIENGKRKYIGIRKTEIDAAKIYDKYVVENNIDRPLNFPEDYPNFIGNNQ